MLPVVVTLYSFFSLALLVYGAKAYVMVALYFRSARRSRAAMEKRARRFEERSADSSLPVVTTQIPIYNEYNVAERVLRAVAAIEYPADRHEIQVLDDSDDETREVVDRVVKELEAAGKRISVLRRPDRSGYKAGALKAGLEVANGAFIAIFDADFVPGPDFLRRALGQFEGKPRRALVQGRWGHLNTEESWLTRALSVGIDGHFVIEQPARSWNGLFLNFNGTGGLWRRAAIEDAGGWRATTLTEDLELSYRVQLRGWELFFMPDLVVPAEIPSSYAAFKSQQFRWAKGSMQTAKLMLPRVLSSDLPLRVKAHSFLHLTQYCLHVCMLGTALLSAPLLLLAPRLSEIWSNWWIAALAPLILVSLGPTQMYMASQYALGRSLPKTLLRMPMLMITGVGICISNTHAVFDGLFGGDSPFVRTPKRGDKPVKRYRVKRTLLPWLEVGMGLYAFVGLALSLALSRYFLAPHLALFAFGFATVGLNTLRESRG